MKQIFGPILFLTSLYFVQGCTSITQTIYLQNIETSGPIKTPPLNITQNRDSSIATISAGISFNSQKHILGKINEHTKVNSSGFFQVDTVMENGQIKYKDSGNNIYDFNGNNFQWDLPDFNLFVNSDLKLSQHVAFSVGANYSIQNHLDLFGGNLGIGFFNENNSGAIRLDFGINIQTLKYYTSSVIITAVEQSGSKGSTVTFFDDEDRMTNWDPYISLTYNSNFTNSGINFFIGGGFFSQSLIRYTPSTPSKTYYPGGITVTRIDKREEATAAFFNLVCGININLSGNSRINAGVRLLKETRTELSSGSLLLMPVMQYDISF